ncbi:MAG: YibE/F family protein [Patescibacteria group bacterium]
MKKIAIFIVLPLLLLMFTGKAHAQVTSETQTGVIKSIEALSSNPIVTGQPNIVLKVELTSGKNKGKEITIDLSNDIAALNKNYQAGNKILVQKAINEQGEEIYYVNDFLRTNALIGLAIIFVIAVLVVSKTWGLASILGMAYSFFIIFKFMLPNLLNGYDPLLVAIVGAILISPVTFYFSHGFNKKTTVALIGTFIALLITEVLSTIAINMSHLTGFGSEEAYFLNLASKGTINMKGIFLAGIIIGTLGILDDVTVSQASIVNQLKKANKTLTQADLFKRAMHVGHDHITSTVNTLILVYTGAAMPLLLLFLNSQKSFIELINTEMVAEEIIRTMVGSIGLIAAVPITTLIAVYALTGDEDDSLAHHH